VSSSSSSAQQARQALGARLREIRAEAGLTARDLGRLMGRHSSKISRIEHGSATPTPADIRAWLEHCQAQDQEADLIASLHAIEGMFIEWHRMERTGLKDAQELVVPLWERTRQFRAYSSWLIPGVVQTRAYTAAVLTRFQRWRNLPDDVDQALSVRVDKQRVLYEGDHRFALLIEESVLRAGVGGADVMVGQLGHLIAASSLPSVSLGILPMRPDRERWPVEDFWIFDDGQVNVELVSGWLTVTQPREIAMYGQVFTGMAEQAVYGAAARALITSAIDDLGAGTTR
jgi:transcriptional regulator with XRE-family HTH domain